MGISNAATKDVLTSKFMTSTVRREAISCPPTAWQHIKMLSTLL
jgi:hypothetical protein